MLRLIERIPNGRYLLEDSERFCITSVAHARRLREHDSALTVGPNDGILFLRIKSTAIGDFNERRRHAVEQRHRRLVSNQRALLRAVGLAFELPLPLRRVG